MQGRLGSTDDGSTFAAEYYFFFLLAAFLCMRSVPGVEFNISLHFDAHTNGLFQLNWNANVIDQTSCLTIAYGVGVVFFAHYQ